MQLLITQIFVPKERLQLFCGLSFLAFVYYFRYDGDEMSLTPVIKLPQIFELSYYANQVISVFTLESIIGKNCMSCVRRKPVFWVSDQV